MTYRRQVATALANALLAGAWTPARMQARAREAVPAVAVAPLVRGVIRAFPEPPPEVTRGIEEHIQRDPAFVRAFQAPVRPRIVRWFLPSPEMGASPWDVPAIATVGDLAEWLHLDVDDLGWLADPKGLERYTGELRLQNYRYRWLPKKSGGARLLEAPKPRLKYAQRHALHRLLAAIPAHPAAHGFRPGRSPLTAALPHVGAAVVLRLDLEDFFASIGPAPVLGVFRAAGYPWEVSKVLAALCTNRAPRSILASHPATGDVTARARQAQRLRTPHLPSGAPTSPALANLCAWGLDLRLQAAATAVGAMYTRYADDLAFSGDDAFQRRTRRFAAFAMVIAHEEGFRVNQRKTRIAGRGARQEVAGIVVNVQPAFPRDRFDALRAMLHNCAVLGPASQNRADHPDFRAHIEGTVAAVQAIDPRRGGRLAEMASQIRWE